jgi:hypothetical protein
MRTNLQIDWKIPNKRHFKLIQICRAIMRYGVDIVWTAKYEGVPAYIKEKDAGAEDKIRCQKDVEFYSDIEIGLDKQPTPNEILYSGAFEKLGSYDTPTGIYNRLTWAKIQEVYAEAKAEQQKVDEEEAENEVPEVVIVA